MTVDSKEKQPRNFIKKVKVEGIKKRLRNPDDVNTTIRISSALREKMAKHCIECDMSMNSFIISLITNALK
jgi:hypothetical protein